MTDQTWTILRLLEWTREFFEARGIDDARLEAELLLAHALGVKRIELYTQHGRVVGEPELSQYRELVKRRAAHVPTQYLLGQAWFRNLTLKVTPAVLIPRPETEILVDEAIEQITAGLRPKALGEAKEKATETAVSENLDATGAPSPGPKGPPSPSRERGEEAIAKKETTERRVLDLCTGSGCIAIALAAECAGVRVVGTDVSAAALAVAEENAAAAGVAGRITWLQGDLFAALEKLPEAERRFDLITANPPYIGEGELAGLMAEVRDHEPREALVAGPTGLEMIERILAEGPGHLAAGGHLLMEIGFAQAEAVRGLAGKKQDWEWLGSRKDFGGHERVVKLRKVKS